MKCAIYGAGSLGTVLGAYLTKNGVDIELVNRNKAHVDTLNAKAAIWAAETILKEKGSHDGSKKVIYDNRT